MHTWGWIPGAFSFLLLNSCTRYFSHSCDQTLDKKQRDRAIMVGKSYQQEHEAACLNTSGWIRKKGEMDAGTQLSFSLSPFYSVQNSRPWDGTVNIQAGGLSTSVKPLFRHPHRHNQRWSSLMPKGRLNPIKLTIKFHPSSAVPSSRWVWSVGKQVDSPQEFWQLTIIFFQNSIGMFYANFFSWLKHNMGGCWVIWFVCLTL